MPNPLYNKMNNNPMANIAQQAMEFKKQFTGNPKDEVQKLLNSGQMSQQQFNELSQIAQQVLPFLGK